MLLLLEWKLKVFYYNSFIVQCINLINNICIMSSWFLIAKINRSYNILTNKKGSPVHKYPAFMQGPGKGCTPRGMM